MYLTTTGRVMLAGVSTEGGTIELYATVSTGVSVPDQLVRRVGFSGFEIDVRNHAAESAGKIVVESLEDLAELRGVIVEAERRVRNLEHDDRPDAGGVKVNTEALS